MRVRLLLIAAALAIVALVGLRSDDQRISTLHAGVESSGRLEAPVRDSAPSAIVSAEANKSGTAQTLPHFEPRRDPHFDQEALATAPRSPLVPDGVARPRSIPLLI